MSKNKSSRNSTDSLDRNPADPDMRQKNQKKNGGNKNDK